VEGFAAGKQELVDANPLRLGQVWALGLADDPDPWYYAVVAQGPLGLTLLVLYSDDPTINGEVVDMPHGFFDSADPMWRIL
jgi:hypothetical protein